MLVETGVAIGVAVSDSLNPATIGEAVVLATGRRPRAAVLAFWGGAFGFYLLLALALAFGPGQLIADFVRNPPPALRLGQLFLGLAAVTTSVFVWRRRHRLRPGRRMLSASPRTAFRLGILLTLADLPNAFPLYGLVAYLAGSDLSSPRQLTVLVIYTFVYLLPVLVVLLARVLAGDRAVPLLRKAREYVERHTATAAAAVLLVGGSVLSVHAAVKLAF